MPQAFDEVFWLSDKDYLKFIAILAYIGGAGLAADGVQLEEAYAQAFAGGLANLQANHLQINWEHEEWYELPLGGLLIAVGYDEGYVAVRVRAEPNYAKEIELASHIFRHFCR